MINPFKKTHSENRARARRRKQIAKGSLKVTGGLVENGDRLANATDKQMELVSVIIPTTKRDRQTDNCVRHVKESTYKNIEVIVVDEGKERSEQRNIGMERAKGEYYLILDSDQLIEDGLIEDCINIIMNNAGVYIPENIITVGFFGRLRNWERRFYTGTAVDVVRFVKKGCPKFDVTMSGPEDSDWDRRIGGDRTISNRCIYHLDEIGVLSYMKKKAYYSKSMAKFRTKHPKDKVLNIWYRCFGIFFENQKWRMVIKKPHYYICLLGVLFVRGVIYKCVKY